MVRNRCRNWFDFTVIFVILVILPNLSAQTPKPLYKLVDKFIGLNPHDTTTFHDKNQRKTINEFWSTIDFLREKEQEQKSLKGSTKFSLNGDQSGNDKLYRYGAGINFTRGNYPSKLTLASEIGMTLNNGTVREDVSSLHISYDYHPTNWNRHWVRDSLRIQEYIFVDRYSDNFLGIDQRYELGCGLIVASWSKRLTEKGGSESKRLNQFIFDPADYDASILKECVRKCYEIDTLSMPSWGDIEILKNAQNRARTALKKEYSTLRVGFLLGAFFETEKITIKDTLETSTGDKQFISQSLTATQKLKWEVRPTIVWQLSDRFALSIRPYFKFGLPGRWYSNVRSETGDRFDKKVDSRVDVQSSIRIKFSSGEDFQSSLLGIELSYRYLYDNAPGRVFIRQPGSTDKMLLVKAQNTHHIVRFSFVMGF